MVGLPTRLIAAHSENMLRPNTCANVFLAISLMSAPAAKARGEPVSTMAPMASSASAAADAALISAISCPHSAFSAAGRCSVSRRTRPPPTVSARSISYGAVGPAAAGDAAAELDRRTRTPPPALARRTRENETSIYKEVVERRVRGKH